MCITSYLCIKIDTLKAEVSKPAPGESRPAEFSSSLLKHTSMNISSRGPDGSGRVWKGAFTYQKFNFSSLLFDNLSFPTF